MNELLVKVMRGDREESVHQASVAVVDAEGKLIWKTGNPELEVFARSCLKPVQALPLILSGTADELQLTEKELAVCCGSHNGEAMHVETVEGMLDKGGLSETLLGCGVHAPYSHETYESLLRSGEKPKPVHNNCSGKHTGLLLTAKQCGYDLGTYLEKDHPLQQEIIRLLGELAGMEGDDIPYGIDGCGLPTFSLPLHKLAYVFARIAKPMNLEPKLAEALIRLRTAMCRFPEMVGGTGEFDTILMKLMQGKVIGKVGAEGVYAMALPERGIGIAIKVSDGNRRAAYPAAVEVLKHLDVLSEAQLKELEEFRKPAITNHKGDRVGELVPVIHLQA